MRRGYSGCVRATLQDMDRSEIESAIRSAFAGVQLGDGVSLRQAEVMDDFGRGFSLAEFKALPLSEVTDDWTRVPESELLRDNAAHLDGKGLRYYLPALMLWLLHHYHDERWLLNDGVDMTTIGTIMALAPAARFEEGILRLYEPFTVAQKTAIASYLMALPRLVDLDDEDATTIARSIERYWGRFLIRSE